MSIYIKSPHEYINATVVGTPTISEGVVSGFSTSNYIKTPETFNPQSNAWEVIIPVVTSSDVSTTQIFGHISATYSMNFNIISGKFNLVHHQTSVSGSLVLQPNTKYYVKISWDEAKYQLAYSTNGVDYTTDITISSSTGVGTVSMLSFGSNGSNTYFSGSIDLTQSYIKINGEYWWKGMEVDQYKEIKRLYKYDKPRYFKTTVESSYEDWVQPVLTANGTMGGDSFACAASSEENIGFGASSAWYAFDGKDNTGGSIQFSDTSGWFSWYNPEPIYIRSILFYVGKNALASSYNENFELQYSDDNVDWNTLTSFVLPSVVETNIDLTAYNISAKYWRLYNPSSPFYMNYAKITAQTGTVTETTIEVTADGEYDRIEFNPLTIKQVYKTDKPKYYKYDGGEEPDVNVVGSLYEYYDNFTGFSDGKYFTFDIGTTELSDLVEFYLNFRIGLDWSDDTNKASGILGGDAFPLIQIYNQKANLGGASATGSYTYNTGEYVKWKIQIQNGVGKIYRLNENNEYELDLTFDYTTPISGTVRVGWNSSTRYLKYGYVYYDGTYVNVNGERRWTITKPVNYNKRYFTFPELTSKGSLGGDEYGVVADGNITGLMNLFQPLVDGKVQTEVYAEFPTSSDGVIFYSPILFCPRNFYAYYCIASDGSYVNKVSTPNIFNLAYSDDGVNWSDEVGYYARESHFDKAHRMRNDYDKNSFHKYWRLSITNISTPIRIGKLVISGYSAEPLTADNCDYSELIPTLVYEHNPTVFQQSTAGTYTFNVTEEAPYEITLVGGGGGGAFNSSGNAGSAAAGNSGSGLIVNAVLKAGTYVLNVGAGGAWSGWLDANTWGGNGSQSSISKDGVVIATAGGGTGNHAWWRSGSAHNSTVGAAPTYTDALGVRDVILNTQGNWGGLAATSSGGASVISGTTWGKGGDTRNRNAADNGNAGCIRIVRLEK